MANRSKSSFLYSQKGNRENDKILLEPYNYLQYIPGDNIIFRTTRALNYWLNISEEKQKLIAEIIQIMEDSNTLVHDIGDYSDMRRGIPVAHSVYGISSTINAAGYALTIALEKCHMLEHPDVLKTIIDHITEMSRGVGKETYYQENIICPTEEEYEKISLQKKKGSFCMAANLMKLFSDNNTNYNSLMDILGYYFQIANDYMNLCSDAYMNANGFCQDITEGRFSFPIIHFIMKNPHNNQVLKILRQKTTDYDIKAYCVSLLMEHGSIEYTREKLSDLHNQAKEEIKRLGGNPDLEKFLNSYHSQI